MTKFFIGVDISKDTLDAAICQAESKEIMDSFQVKNSLQGIDQILVKAEEYCPVNEVMICFEHTGNYGLLLAHHLSYKGVAYSAVPAVEIQRSIGLTRGKNDQIDARRIAEYAAIQSHKLKPSKLPGSSLLKIKHLLTHRDMLVRTCSKLKNHLKELELSNQVIDLKELIRTTRRNIKQFTKQIKEVEQHIEQLIDEDEDLKKNYELAQSVTGVGPMVASHMLLITNNFTSFTDPRRFNSYSGTAPFEHSSGSSIRGKTKTSPWRNRTMKSLLFNGAYSAVRHDPQLAKYYQRKLEEGKAKQSVINAVACKLVYRVFAVVKRGEPFVKLSY